MPGLLDFSSPGGGLLGGDQQSQDFDWRRLLDKVGNFGTGLLAMSGPSPYPVSWGQGIAAGMQNVQQGEAARAQQGIRDLQARQIQSDLKKSAFDLKRQEDWSKFAMGGAFPGSSPSPSSASNQVADASGQIGWVRPSTSPAQGFDAIPQEVRMYAGLMGPDAGAKYIADWVAKRAETNEWKDEDNNGIKGQRSTRTNEFKAYPAGVALPKAPEIKTIIEGGKEVTYEIHPDGQRVKIAEGPRWQGQQGDPNLKMQNVSNLRKEFQDRPEVKNAAIIKPILESMEEASTRNTRAADLNLVYGIGKLFDPGSVVREGEMVMVTNTSALPDWVIGAINRVNGKQGLQAETRNAIMAEARSRGKVAFDQAGQVADQFRGLATRYGIPPEDIVMGPNPTVRQPAGTQPAPTTGRTPAPPPGFKVVGGPG